jgi:anti-sigma factor RsiW
MDCQRVSELLDQYFDGELSSDLTIEVESALGNCQHCQEELALLTEMREAIRGPVLKELQEVSLDGMWQRIQTEISEGSVDEVVQERVVETAPGWFESLKELFAARPFIPLGMGAVAAAALFVVLLPVLTEQLPMDSAQTTGATNGPVAGTDQVDKPVNNIAFVSGVQYETGSIFIDQDPDDPEAPLIVWQIDDETISDPEGG